MTGTVRHLFEIAIPYHKEEKLREWASANAYTLLFITGFFILTWVLIILDILLGITR